MKRFGSIFFVLLMMIFSSCDSQIKNVVGTKNQNIYECEYKKVQRKFSLYLPDENQAIMGLIFMLHGYGETIVSFRSKTKMDETACKKNFAVCYVSSVPEAGWNSSLGSSKKDDEGFIKNLALHFQKKYNVKKENTILLGFSNGAFLTGELSLKKTPFHSFVCVAGLPPISVWEKEKQKSLPNLFLIYGTKDDIIPIRESKKNLKYSFPFLEDLVESWCEKNQLENLGIEKIGKDSDLIKYENQNKKLWVLKIKNGGHQWFQERTTGFELNNVIMDFFD